MLYLGSCQGIGIEMLELELFIILEYCTWTN